MKYIVCFALLIVVWYYGVSYNLWSKLLNDKDIPVNLQSCVSRKMAISGGIGGYMDFVNLMANKKGDLTIMVDLKKAVYECVAKH